MKDSAIQWTDHTFNPWEGCTKVAPECKNCYAETLVDHRFGRVKWGKGQPRRRTSEATWRQPYAWNRAAEQQGVRKKVFCLSLGDIWDEEVPYKWRYDLWEMIQDTTWLDWQLLTKRPQNAPEMIAELAVPICEQWDCEGIPPSNVWLGVSAGVDPKPILDLPAVVHFLSCEPMLHALDTKHAAGFDWIIFGGESGKNARPCDVRWIRDGVAFCKVNGIAAFVKQFGARPFENYEGVNPTPAEERQWHRNGWCKISFADGSGRSPVWSKNYRLRDSHGGDMSEWPEDLRVREFPRDVASSVLLGTKSSDGSGFSENHVGGAKQTGGED